MLLTALLIPLAGGLLLPLVKIKNRNVLYTLVLALEAATAVLLTVIFAKNSADAVHIRSITDTLRISLSADSLGRFCGLLAGWGWLLTTVFATAYMKHEQNEKSFAAFLLLTEAFVLGVMFSDNLFSLYMFFEFVTLASFPMVLHSRRDNAVNAAFSYIFYSVAGAFMGLFGILVLNHACPGLDFAAGGTLSGEVTPLVLAGVFIAVLGFGAKAGLYPLHAWLPAAHPVAPAPASALLSGLITKSGVVAIIRVIYFVAGPDSIRGTWVQTALLVMALVTVVAGSGLAFAEKEFKKRLAYSSVSQISYVLTGLFLLTGAGLTGAVLQIAFHAAVKVGLFLCAGALIFLTGKTNVDDYRGVGVKYPVIMWCYTLLSLSLIGVPPFGGFFSKWFTVAGAFDAFGAPMCYIVPAALIVSALFTAGYLLPVATRAFFPGREESAALVRRKEPVAMCVPLIILSAFALIGGLFFGSLSDFAASVVASIM